MLPNDRIEKGLVDRDERLENVDDADSLSKSKQGNPKGERIRLHHQKPEVGCPFGSCTGRHGC